MQIKLLDQVLEQDGLNIEKTYPVVRTETMRDDLFYVVENEMGMEVHVHELLAKEI